MRAASPPATWPNNDADASSPQGLKLESVKNLYCTATTENNFPIQREKSDHSCDSRGGMLALCAQTSCDKCEQGERREQADWNADQAGRAACHKRRDPDECHHGFFIAARAVVQHGQR